MDEVTTNHHPQRVRLDVPAAPEYVLLARLTVSGFAGRHGASVEEVEDLKVLTAEVCRLLVSDTAPDATLQLTYEIDDGALVLEAVGSGIPEDDDELAVHLIEALADEHLLDAPAASRRIRVVKRLA